MELALDLKSRNRGGRVSDARTGKRFPLELPIKFHRAEESSEHDGVTGNLSAAGVYIRADDPTLEVGSNVEFEIALPPELTGGNENVVVQCKGRVVRKDGEGGESQGVACVIDTYDFVRQP